MQSSSRIPSGRQPVIAGDNPENPLDEAPVSSWLPEWLTDEEIPPTRPSPDAWLMRDDDGGWALDNGWGDESFVVRPGGVIEFQRLDEYPDITIDDGLPEPDDYDLPLGYRIVSGAVDPRAQYFGVKGKSPDFLRSLDDVILHMEESGRVVVAQYSWSDPIPHRLVVEDGVARFERVGA